MVHSENSSLFHMGLFIQTHPACWKTNQQAYRDLLKEGKEYVIISALSIAQSVGNCEMLQYCNAAFLTYMLACLVFLVPVFLVSC